jgi:hypothetical protein
LQVHTKLHDVGFVPGKSVGERAIFEALVASGHRFLPEYTFPGQRTRYDFAIFGPENLTCLIEYDGKGHYGPIFDSRTCQEGFIQQVGRDLNKSRYVREIGLGLLRYTMDTYKGDAVARDIAAGAWATNKVTFRDYVFGEVFVPGCVLVDTAKLAVDPASFPPSMCDDAAAVELLLCLPQVSDLVFDLRDDDDGDGSLFDFAALHLHAIVVVFAYQHKKLTIEQVAVTAPRAAQAFLYLFLQVPEFFGQRPCSTAHDVREDDISEDEVPQKRVCVERAADDTFENVHVPFMTCWMCEPPIRYKAKLNVGFVMLDHMALSHHGQHFPVGCPYCPSSLDHQPFAQDGQWLHSEHCTMDTVTAAMRKYKRCQTCQLTFSVPHLLFRHLNSVHGAKFSDVCTLKCSDCEVSFKTSSALRQHACDEASASRS